MNSHLWRWLILRVSHSHIVVSRIVFTISYSSKSSAFSQKCATKYDNSTKEVIPCFIGKSLTSFAYNLLFSFHGARNDNCLLECFLCRDRHCQFWNVHIGVKFVKPQLIRSAFYSIPALTALKEILSTTPTVTFYGFLVALSKSETINRGIGEYCAGSDFLDKDLVDCHVHWSWLDASKSLSDLLCCNKTLEVDNVWYCKLVSTDFHHFW